MARRRHGIPRARDPRATVVSRRTALALTLAAVHPGSAHAQGVTPPWRKPRRDLALERIAFGSCLRQRLPQPIWKSVLAARPELFIMLGDNVYGDVSDATLKEMKAAYAMQAAQAELAAVRAEVPFLATWDDHDYGYNDASAEFPHKAGTRALFAEFWGLSAADLPPEGIYRAEVIGPPGRRVQVILLDLRTFRSAFAEAAPAERLSGSSQARYKPDPSPEKTMLGEAQWAWLETQLQVPAEIRLLASSTQLLAEHHNWERWGNLPRERERLFRLIGSTGAKGLIALSGDRHRAAIYKRTEGLPYALYDVTSSALNTSVAGNDPDDAGRIGPMLSEDNFGLVTIDWSARRLTLALRRLSGIPDREITVPFSALGL